MYEAYKAIFGELIGLRPVNRVRRHKKRCCPMTMSETCLSLPTEKADMFWRKVTVIRKRSLV